MDPDVWLHPMTEKEFTLNDDLAYIYEAGDWMTNLIHSINKEAGWWNDLDTGEDLHGKRNIGELLMLVVSELTEAMEGHRKNLTDKHLPSYTQFSVELADAIIRIFDIAGSENIPLGSIIVEKLKYNHTRQDHQKENRRLENGKKY